MQALSIIHHGYVFRFKLLNTTFIIRLIQKVDDLHVKDYQI